MIFSSWQQYLNIVGPNRTENTNCEGHTAGARDYVPSPPILLSLTHQVPTSLGR